MKNKNTAFTLVELIVVIVILAILGTLGFISFQGWSERSRNTVRIANAEMLLKQITFESLRGANVLDYIDGGQELDGGYIGGRELSITTEYKAGTVKPGSPIVRENFKDPLGDAYLRVGFTNRYGGLAEVATVVEKGGALESYTIGTYLPRDIEDTPIAGVTGSNRVELSSISDIGHFQVGDVISGPGIPSGTIITDMDGTESVMTLSEELTADTSFMSLSHDDISGLIEGHHGNGAAEHASSHLPYVLVGTGDIQDTDKPRITLNGNEPMAVLRNTPYNEPGAIAIDPSEGDISGFIQISGTVNTAVLGEYTITYNVSDPSGNAANEVTRTVEVVPGNIPVITMNGITPVQVLERDPYTDAGAIATDVEDGIITPSMVTVNNVNSNVAGTYTVTYNVEDSQGNAALEVTRQVVVHKGDDPVISINGASSVDVLKNTPYTDSGASASDTEDGDISGIVVTNNTVDTSLLGTYTVTYYVTDSHGNTDEQTRSVNVVSGDIPAISINGASSVDVLKNTPYTDSGASASDTEDGDVTGSIITVNNVNTSVLGTYTVTYNVTDSQDNAANEVIRTVNVVSGNAPEITLSGSSSVSVLKNTPYTDSGASASDTEDGDVTGSIVTVNPVDTSLLGTYTVTYNVTDSQDNAASEVTRTVNVVGGSIPEITLNGSSTVSLLKNTVYNDAGASASDLEDGDISGSIVTINSIDTSVLGTQTVTYNVTDSQDNAASEVTRTVNIISGGSPSITRTGSDTIYVLKNTSYSDAGATASDPEQGNISGSIVTTNPVNIGVDGTYTVRYNVTDSQDNAASEVTRTVHVYRHVNYSSNSGTTPCPSGYILLNNPGGAPTGNSSAIDLVGGSGTFNCLAQ